MTMLPKEMNYDCMGRSCLNQNSPVESQSSQSAEFLACASRLSLSKAFRQATPYLHGTFRTATQRDLALYIEGVKK